MPGIARGDGVDSVASPDGIYSGDGKCKEPSEQATDQASKTVFVEGIGVVREGDPMVSHSDPNCNPHDPGLDSFSPTVFVEGLGVGRDGDTYGGDHRLTSGSETVFAN